MAIPSHFRDRLFTPSSWARLAARAEVVLNPAGGDLDADEARAVLREADILLSGWGTAARSSTWIASAPRLRALVHSAGSLRIIADDSTFRSGIQVSSQADQNGRPVAEYALAMILLGVKRTFRVEREFRSSRGAYPLDDFTGGGFGARVGIIGASRIGRRLLRLLEPFDFDIGLYDPFVSADEAERLGARLTGLDELFERSDVVSVHAPLLESTEGMIGGRQLDLMPDGAVFINTARGALVDQDALVRRLLTGRIDAVLDVTVPEVLPPSSPLWGLPNVVLTPHMAGSIGNEMRRLGEEAISEIERLLDGTPLRYAVTRDAFAIMA